MRRSARVAALLLLPLLAGCLGTDSGFPFEGAVTVQGTTITAVFTNTGDEPIELLPATCNYGFSFEVRDAPLSIVAAHQGVTSTGGTPCTDAPRVPVAPGQSVRTSWTWQDPQPGDYEAWVGFVVYGRDGDGPNKGHGPTVVEPFSV